MLVSCFLVLTFWIWISRYIKYLVLTLRWAHDSSDLKFRVASLKCYYPSNYEKIRQKNLYKNNYNSVVMLVPTHRIHTLWVWPNPHTFYMKGNFVYYFLLTIFSGLCRSFQGASFSLCVSRFFCIIFAVPVRFLGIFVYVCRSWASISLYQGCFLGIFFYRVGRFFGHIFCCAIFIFWGAVSW